MNLLAREIERGLAGLERVMGQPTFTWNDKDYPCAPGRSDEEQTFGEGGFSPAWAVVLNVRTSVFGAEGRPQDEQFFGYQGHTYRVGKVNPSVEGAWLKIFGVDADKGA